MLNGGASQDRIKIEAKETATIEIKRATKGFFIGVLFDIQFPAICFSTHITYDN